LFASTQVKPDVCASARARVNSSCARLSMLRFDIRVLRSIQVDNLPGLANFEVHFRSIVAMRRDAGHDEHCGFSQPAGSNRSVYS
jgi:hypothetical protein